MKKKKGRLEERGKKNAKDTKRKGRRVRVRRKRDGMTVSFW